MGNGGRTGRRTGTTTLAFPTVTSYIAWAAQVDSEAPGLRQQLIYGRTQRGGCLVKLCLYDGRPLTEDGHDVVVDIGRRSGCLRSVSWPE